MKTGSSDSPPSTRRTFGYPGAALLSFLVVSLFVSLSGQNDNSAWIKMTSPSEALHASNSQLGFAYTMMGKPLHKENVSFLSQVLFFRGADQGKAVLYDLYYVRPFVSFTAACMFPFLPAHSALMLVNLLSWGLAALVTWRFTRALGGSEKAAFLAVLFCAGGMGYVSHIGDLSAHLMSFALYYAGVYILFASRVHEVGKPLRTHLSIGLFLAIASLQYNTGLLLTLGYVLLSLRKNKYRHVLAGALVALSAQYSWVCFLSLKTSGGLAHFHWLDIYSQERGYLGASLAHWATLVPAPRSLALTVLQRAAEFMSFDSPPLVLLGIASFLVLAKRRILPRMFGIFLVLPFVAGMVYANSATARGYLVYGASILLYAPLAILLSEDLDGAKTRRRLCAGLLVVALPLHFLWSLAHLQGHLGPVKAYFLGFNHGYGLLISKPVTESFTGSEPTPSLFGGRGRLPDSGSFVAPRGSPRSVAPMHWWTAVQNRAVIALYLLALVLTLAPRRKRLSLLGGLGFLTLALIMPGLAATEYAGLVAVDDALRFGNSSVDMTYSITLSDEVRQDFHRLRTPEDEVEFYFRGGEARITILLDTESFEVLPAPHTPYCYLVADKDRFADSVKTAKTLTLHLENATGTIGGWQRSGLPGRTLDIQGGRSGSFLLPSLELRLRDRNGFLKFAAF